MREQSDYSLLQHNTFGIDARCRRFVEYATVKEAREVALSLHDPFLIIGGGSNLLLTGNYEGTVVHSAIRGIEPTVQADGTVLLRVGSGEVWDEVVALCVERGWHGAENLSLIPGEVGATAVQNIGAYGAEASHIIYKVEAVGINDGQTVTIDAADCHYGYRQSRFKGEWRNRYLITYVTYRLTTTFTPLLDYGNIRNVLSQRMVNGQSSMVNGQSSMVNGQWSMVNDRQPTAKDLRQAIIDIRREKLPDPAVEGNAGSFFMNPVVERPVFERLLQQYPQMPHYAVDETHVKIPAGWLIEQCGWKGRSLGHAGVHNRQALVLVNRGGATGADIVALSNAIRTSVHEKFGITIVPEVNIV
jgi:UDP-N-acetylmuramate dehydrogenase